MTRRGKILFSALIFAGVVAVGATRILSPPATSSVAPFDWRSGWGLEEEFSLSIDTEGYQYPSAIAFVPEPGADPKDPLYFVTELRGAVKVVTNDRSVYTFAEGFFTPTSPRDFPAPEGQRGLAGICLEPQHGYIFVTFTYQDEQGVLRNSIVRFDSRPGTFSLRAESYRTLTEIFSAYESAPPTRLVRARSAMACSTSA